MASAAVPLLGLIGVCTETKPKTERVLPEKIPPENFS